MPAEAIRNVAFCGHSTSGKTSLVEAILKAAGAIDRAGTVDDGNTVCDYDPQEKDRKHSLDLACASFLHDGVRINALDTPGYRDFIGQFYCAVAAVDSVVVVVSADVGVQPTTRKVWEVAAQLGLPRLVVVNRLDREHADWDGVLAQIQEQLDPACVPCTAPNGSGAAFTSVTSLLGGSGEHASQLTESVVETDEALMERYLEGEEPSKEELIRAFRGAIASNSVFPVFATSAASGVGVPELLTALVEDAPNATQLPSGRKAHAPNSEEPVALDTSTEGPFVAQVVKEVSDPYVGKLTFIRVYGGSLATNGTFSNPHTHKSEKVGKIVRLFGKEQQPVDAATAGDIIAFVKLESLKTFDVITTGDPLVIDPPSIPTPMCSFAVSPKTKADEKKFAESFVKLVDEDVTLVAIRDKRTHELVVSGMSQLHLQEVWHRLKSRYGVEVETKEPKVPYLETIAAKGDAQYRHKKQTGGAGEFAEVWLRVEPTERGAGIEFKNEVFGGAIGGGYVQSAEKGIRAVMEEGLLSGCPIVDCRVVIYDGKEHPVDSKDIAFQKAGREAFKQAFLAAKPVLLEPIVHLEVTFPADHTGDIQGDLNRRRGRVQGVDALGAFQVLKALVPLAEIADYASTLGSISAGQGSFIIEPAHYEAVPGNVQKQVVESFQKDHTAAG